jgi:hypothetical protein
LPSKFESKISQNNPKKRQNLTLQTPSNARLTEMGFLVRVDLYRSEAQIKSKKFKNLEERILLLQRQAEKGPLSLEEILHILSGRGQALALILLSIPFCQPLQIPGTSFLFGLMPAFKVIRKANKKKLWLPKKSIAKKI